MTDSIKFAALIAALAASVALACILVASPSNAAMSKPTTVTENLVCMTYQTQADIDSYIEGLLNHPAVSVVEYLSPHEGYDGFVKFWFTPPKSGKSFLNETRWYKGRVCETTRDVKNNS